ncbi:hypothetical protein APHAL10511_008478 [Amanita phalloides]|nr:hypothetical protein APHAL10511_008478 [Amanita phalloides]
MPNHRTTDKTKPGARRLAWGIFHIAYVPLRPSILPQLSISSFLDAITLSRYMFKLFLEIYYSSRLNAVLFVLCCVWLSTSPAVSLYLASRTLHILDKSSSVQAPSLCLDTYGTWVACWFFSMTLTVFVRRKHDALINYLAGHLRARLLPRLATASLRLDMRYTKMPLFDSAFQTDSCSFGSVPQMDILCNFVTRLGNIFRVLLEITIVIWILNQAKDHTARLFATIGICMVVFSTCFPTNWIGGAGYTFWTTHPAFQKLHALHSMIFEIGYRETICKDGIANRLEHEFKMASEELGPQDIDTWRLASYVEPIPWYWEVGQSMVFENPMIVFAVISMWNLPASALFSMALIQYAVATLKLDFYRLRSGYANLTLRDMMLKAKALYETIERMEDEPTLTPYPTPTSNNAGMKVSLKHVSVTYEGELDRKETNAVVNVSLDIEPGQLVVIVGKNGSGKSSLLKLLPMITQPSSGDIYIDDNPINEYDINHLRNSMAVLSQDEALFPLSLRDNILMGLTDRALHSNSPWSKECMVEHAAKLAGSWDIIHDVGADTILNPVRVVRQSMECVGNGKIDRAAYAELDRCAASAKPIMISSGEKQRLLATRIMIRALNDENIKLIIADEPSSALDPIAERGIFSTFMRMRKGRTVIFVTHRFRYLVEHADLILCMADGRVVERGTHDQLIQSNGEYAGLYHAQASVSGN